MVFSFDPFAIYDFNSIDFVWVISQITKMNRPILALAQDFLREHDLDFVTRKSNNFAAGFKFIFLICTHILLLLSVYFSFDLYLIKI